MTDQTESSNTAVNANSGIRVSPVEREARFQESESRFQAVFEHSPDGIVVVDPATHRFIQGNRAFAQMLGCTTAEVADLGVERIHEPEHLPQILDLFERLMRGEIAVAAEIPVKPRKGPVFYADISAYRITLDGRNCVAGVFRDITEARQAQSALQESHQRLSDLARRLIDAQEAERRRLARELHDQFGQTLTVLQATLGRVLLRGTESIEQCLLEAQAQVAQLMVLTRDFSLDLRPMELDDLGLVAALVAHFDRTAARLGLHVTFQHSRVIDQRFEVDIESAVYRIVQEALTNVARHAGVMIASVRLWRNASGLFAQVQDQGRGFDPISTSGFPHALGLRGMQERARLLGGRVAIESQPGSGTTITAEFPLLGSLRGDRGCRETSFYSAGG